MRNKKGLALPIETIIVIILAVTVLTVLVTFFLGVWGDKTKTIGDLEEQLTGDCLSLISKSGGNCNYQTMNSAAKTVADRIYNKMSSSTTSLEICSCPDTGNREDDIKKCLSSCCATYCGNIR